MSCTTVRIDDQDFNSTAQVNPAHPVYDAARKKVYFVYCDLRTSRNSTDGENRAVVFREYDETLDTLGTPVVIDEITHGVAEDSDNIDRASIVRLDDAVGTLICAYNYFSTSDSLYKTRVKESTDNGLTWSAAVNMDSEVGSTRQFVDLGTDGTNVWGFTYQQGGGSGGQQLWFWKRTAASTWSTPGILVYDGHVGGSSAAEFFWQYLGGKKTVIVVDSLIGYIVGERLDSGTTMRVVCFRTTDGGASWTEVVIKNYSTISFHYPITFLGSDGVARTMWVETHPIYPSTTIPVIASTNDDGATWSVVGSPTLLDINNTTVWKPQNKGFFLAANNDMVVSTWKQTGGVWAIEIYRGTLSLTDWELLATCDIGSEPNSNLVGTSVLMSTDYIQVLDPIPQPPGTYYAIAYLREADIDTPTNPPPLIEESPSGSDAANKYLRNRLAEKKGWSVHDLPVSAWAVWPEGDYTTQRRKPILLAGRSTIDPSVTDPTVEGAIYKVDDPAHLGRESWTRDADGNVVRRYDPFAAEWRSKAFALSKDFEWEVFRAIQLRYRRPSLPVTVEFWIDGVVHQTDVLSATGPDDGGQDIARAKDVFLSLDPYDNVGNVGQLRILDETTDDLVIEACEIVYINKRRRGYE